MNENMTNTAATAADQALTLPSGQPVLPGDETVCACCGAVVKITDCAPVANGKLVCGDCLAREFTQCADCGQWFPPDALIATANGDVVCVSCLERDYSRCDCCGDWFLRDETTETGNGDRVCESCLAVEYFCCEDCGEWFPTDDAVEVNPGTRASGYVCEDCADRNYRRCDDCGNYYDDDHIALADAYHDICENCSDDWCSCSCCGEVLRTEDAVYDDDAGEYYCSDCAPSSRLHDYGYKPDPVFGTTDAMDGASFYNGDDLTFGVELECDGGDSVADALADIDRITDRCYCKHDGSLSDGYEIVTHPGTLAWHKERFPWARVCEASVNNGFRSHDTDTCGLHVHVGRDQLGDNSRETAAKMSVITYRLKDWFVRFSRRGGESRWAQYVKPRFPLRGDDHEFLREYYDLLERDRYLAVNVRNGNTVEVRIFRGTLNPSTVLACLELVSNLALYARDHELEDCLAVTWDELVHYEEHEELTDYCSRRMTSSADFTTNAVPVAEPLPDPVSSGDVYPGGCNIMIDSSNSSALLPGDIVCCVDPGQEGCNPVGCCGLVTNAADRETDWIVVEWFTPGAHRWETSTDLSHRRDGRGWGVYRRDVRRVIRIGNHEMSSNERDYTIRVFEKYGLLPGDRVEVVNPRLEDAYRVEGLTGTYLLATRRNIFGDSLCEIAWQEESVVGDEIRGGYHDSNGLRPGRTDGWRVVASNLRRVDN